MNKLAMEVKFLVRKAHRREMTIPELGELNDRIVAAICEAADEDHPTKRFLELTEETREWIASHQLRR